MYRIHALTRGRQPAGFALVASLLLAAAAPAPASIGRTQSFTIGATNPIDWGGGIGSARSDNQSSFSQMQQGSIRCVGLSATQVERGSLTQSASASGASPSTVRQTADIKGTQDLLGEGNRQLTGRAQQDLNLKMVNRLVQPGGVGSVSGTQTYTGQQGQTLISPSGTSSQSQSVDVRQSGSITTPTNIDPSLRSTITINLQQTQLTQ